MRCAVRDVCCAVRLQNGGRQGRREREILLPAFCLLHPIFFAKCLLTSEIFSCEAFVVQVGSHVVIKAIKEIMTLMVMNNRLNYNGMQIQQESNQNQSLQWHQNTSRYLRYSM